MLHIRPTKIKARVSNRATPGISSFETTLPSPPRFPITRKLKKFKIPLKLLMDHLEKENAKMGLEASEELTRITKIKACHILSEDQDYIKKVMFDSVKERKSEIIFLL